MAKEYKYHYVYRITNKILNKHYYGSRSCNIEPKLDLGINYYSSSKDKEFRLDQITNPQNYRYKIVKIFDSRHAALQFEIKLHTIFDVGVNTSFYNRCKQTTKLFDMTGRSRTHSVKTRNKISENNKGKHSTPLSEETKNKMRKPKSDKHKENISKARKGITLSIHTIEKIKEARSKQVFSEETRKKMREAQQARRNREKS